METQTRIAEVDLSHLTSTQFDVYRSAYKAAWQEFTTTGKYTFAEVCEMAASAARIALAFQSEFYEN